MGIWQKLLGSWERLWDIHIKVNPIQVYWREGPGSAYQMHFLAYSIGLSCLLFMRSDFRILRLNLRYFVRSGRLDRKIEFPAPTEEARARIMQIHSRKMNVSPDVNFDELARSTDDFNGAQCKVQWGQQIVIVCSFWSGKSVGKVISWHRNCRSNSQMMHEINSFCFIGYVWRTNSSHCSQTTKLEPFFIKGKSYLYTTVITTFGFKMST